MTRERAQKPIHVAIEDEGFADGRWVSHYFTIGTKSYFLPHTPEAPYWELMRDMGEAAGGEYRTVAVGTAAVRRWLHAHNVHGIL